MKKHFAATAVTLSLSMGVYSGRGWSQQQKEARSETGLDQPMSEPHGKVVRDIGPALRVQDMTDEELRERLAEYEAGKRDYRDGYIILNQLWFNYQVKQMTGSAKFQEIVKRREDLLLKHPELKNLQDVRLSENIQADRKQRKEKATELERAKAWKPQDTSPRGFFAHGSLVAVKYQYRIEFFKFADHFSFFQAEDSGWKMRDARAPSAAPVPVEIPQNNPAKILSFKNNVAVYPRNTLKNPPLRLLVCTRHHSYYAPTTTEERTAVRAKGFEHGMPWKNEPGAREHFCGVVDLTGAVVYEFPREAGRLLLPLDIVDNGTRAGVLVGKETKEQSFENGRDILSVGQFQEMLVWEYPNTLKRIKLKDKNVPDHVWYQRFIKREL